LPGIISASESYLESLGPVYKCPKSCGGTMVEVYVSYEPQGQLKKEWECTKCGKVVKGTPQQKENRRWVPKKDSFKEKRYKR